MWPYGGKHGRAIASLVAGARGGGAGDVEDAGVWALLRWIDARLPWRTGGCCRYQFWLDADLRCKIAMNKTASGARLIWVPRDRRWTACFKLARAPVHEPKMSDFEVKQNWRANGLPQSDEHEFR
jgi:hypothetical protein